MSPQVEWMRLKMKASGDDSCMASCRIYLIIQDPSGSKQVIFCHRVWCEVKCLDNCVGENHRIFVWLFNVALQIESWCMEMLVQGYSNELRIMCWWAAAATTFFFLADHAEASMLFMSCSMTVAISSLLINQFSCYFKSSPGAWSPLLSCLNNMQQVAK